MHSPFYLWHAQLFCVMSCCNTVEMSHSSSLPFQDAYDSDDAGGDDELNAADKDVKDASVKWTGTAWWQKFAEAGVASCSMLFMKLPSSGRAMPGGRTHTSALLHVRELRREAAGLPLAAEYVHCLQVASLVFVAEWGDRSMLATIALGASQSAVGELLSAPF